VIGLLEGVTVDSGTRSGEPRSEGRVSPARREYIVSNLDPKVRLSRHAITILELWSQGFTALDIARKVNIARDTVYEELGTLRKRLGAKNTRQLIRLGIRHGFTEL
jgi:DNA-binding CsgD family transcriptional regulator